MRRNKEAYRQFYTLLRETRERQGVAQKMLAEALKVPQSFISKLESGERRTDVVELISILEKLEVKVERFLGELTSRWSNMR